MKASDLRSKSAEELQTELLGLLKEQFSLRMQHATQQLASSAQLSRVRRDIARVRTIQRQLSANQGAVSQ